MTDFEAWVTEKFNKTNLDFLGEDVIGFMSDAWNAGRSKLDQEMQDCALEAWVWLLPKMQQTVLMCAIPSFHGERGLGIRCEAIQRALRATFLHYWVKRDESTLFNFMSPTRYPDVDFQSAMYTFGSEFGSYPMGFIATLMQAAEIVGYKHPDQGERERWLDFYGWACCRLCVAPETRDAMEARLSV